MFVIKTYGGFLISQVRQIGNRAFEKILRDSGIDAFNGPQGRILYVLWEHDNLSITDIAKLTSLANTTLTGMLDRMESQGLIMRVPDKKNRRKIIIETTSEAEKLRAAYNEVSERANEIFYAGFNEDEVVVFEDTLRRIINNFEEHENNEK